MTPSGKFKSPAAYTKNTKNIKDQHTLRYKNKGYKIYYIKYTRYRKYLNTNSELNIY